MNNDGTNTKSISSFFDTVSRGLVRDRAGEEWKYWVEFWFVVIVSSRFWE